MVTGAARAEAALLVLDAGEGIQENTRRHAYLLSMLGVRQIAVVVNKMDLVGCRQEAFDDFARELGDFLGTIDMTPAAIIPVIGREGDNLAMRSAAMSWYTGPTVLEALDAFRSQGKRWTGPSACRCRPCSSSRTTATTVGSSPARSTAVACAWATRSSSIRRASGPASSRSRRSTAWRRPWRAPASRRDSPSRSRST
jgi:sulfate adenylyltransferase subunit 1 (EFTu-like GTPase family)